LKEGVTTETINKRKKTLNDTFFDISLWKKKIFWKSTSTPRDRAFHGQIVPLKCLVEHQFQQ
jgi:hypothetical protein